MSSWSSFFSTATSAVSGAGWLWPDLDLQITLSAGASVGEPYLSDDLGGEVFAVPSEAYIGGVAWTYMIPDEAGGTVGPYISGTVRVEPRLGVAANPARGVWHGGIEVRLRGFIHYMDPFVDATLLDVRCQLIGPGYISAPLELPFSVGGETPRQEAGESSYQCVYVDSYIGTAMAIRYVLSVTALKPWYAVSAQAALHVPLRLYSLRPCATGRKVDTGGEKGTGVVISESVGVVASGYMAPRMLGLGVAPRAPALPPTAPSTDPSSPPLVSGATTVDTVFGSAVGAAESDLAGPQAVEYTATQFALSLPRADISMDASLPITVRFSNVDRDDPISLVQIVLLRAEFASERCISTEAVLVHTLLGCGAATYAELPPRVALSRGYLARTRSRATRGRMAVGGAVGVDSLAANEGGGDCDDLREQDPIREDCEFFVEIPLTYRPAWDPASPSPRADVLASAPAPALTADGETLLVSREAKEQAAARAQVGCRYEAGVDFRVGLWRPRLGLSPSMTVMRPPHLVDSPFYSPQAPSPSPLLVPGSGEDAADGQSQPVQGGHLVCEVAVRYYLRVIAQDQRGRNYHATTDEVRLYRESRPALVETADAARDNDPSASGAHLVLVDGGSLGASTLAPGLSTRSSSLGTASAPSTLVAAGRSGALVGRSAGGGGGGGVLSSAPRGSIVLVAADTQV